MFPDGVLITGSLLTPYDTAELYLPFSGESCSLPQLPDDRHGHTVESSGRLCGGYDTSDTCLLWSPDTGSWEEELYLDTERHGHVSWTPDNGIGTYLMGGYGRENERTASLIKHDGTQEAAFTLEHDIL